MNKIIKAGVAVTMLSVSGMALAGGCCENSTIQQYDAYGLGVHSDQYGQPVTVQPKHGYSGYNPLNRIQERDAYGPNIHMDSYGRPATVQPFHERNRILIFDGLNNPWPG
jgi:hypothetical protein